MKKESSKDKSPGKTEEAHRMVFRIPSGYPVEELAKALSGKFFTGIEKEAEYRQTPEGWLVQVRDAGGRLGRMVRRRSEAMHIIISVEKDDLFVKMVNGKWVESIKEAPKKSGFFSMAADALEATSHMADVAVSGLSEFWNETGTEEAVFDFISRHIAESCGFSPSDPRKNPFPPLAGRYVEDLSPVEYAWLGNFLETHEILLAWLHTSSGPPESVKAKWRFVMTTHRTALAAFCVDRFESLLLIPAGPMKVTDKVGRDTVTIGENVFRTQLNNDSLFQEIAILSPLPPVQRLIEIARLHFISKDSKAIKDYALPVMDHVIRTAPNPIHELSRLYMDRFSGKKEGLFEGLEKDPVFRELTVRLINEAEPEALKAWADLWGLSPSDALTLSEKIDNAGRDSVGHARLTEVLMADARDGIVKGQKDKTLLIPIDIRFAENLISCGKKAEAEKILMERSAELPDESLSDLLPPVDSDLTKGEGGQMIRVRILDLLAEAREKDGKPHLPTLLRLATLQPLVRERLLKLHEATSPEKDGELRSTLECILSILDENGLYSEKKIVPPGRAKPLSPSEIQEKIRHPASREGSFLGKIQNFIATKKVPDHAALKSYARRVDPDRFPDLTSSIADASLILGLKGIDAYISYGDLNTGIRGYEGNPPFLLIGGEHVEENNPSFLSPSELSFMVGVELAHLRFKHERITSREVWEGAFNKAFSLIELFPVVGGYIGKLGSLGKFAGQASDVAKKVGGIKQYVSHAKSVATTAQGFYEKKGGERPVMREEEMNLIGAFREMQLTADRAALVICGDLPAAVRAVFKSTPVLLPELSVLKKCGLADFLSRTDESGNLLYQDLAIRLAALFSFHLSEEYKALRRAAFSA